MVTIFTKSPLSFLSLFFCVTFFSPVHRTDQRLSVPQENYMDIETLRTINFSSAILLPMWVIGPLMRRGLRYWIVLVAIFLLMLASQYLVLVCDYPQESAFLRALGMAAMMMMFGYIWARALGSAGGQQSLIKLP